MPHPKKTSRWFGGILVSLAIFLVMLEGGVRLRMAQLARRQVAQEHQRQTRDSPYLHSEQPRPAVAKMSYHSFLSYIPAKNISEPGYRTNGQHFRETANLPFRPAANEKRIFVTGGSAAWGAGCIQENTISHFLEQALAGDYPNANVINAGVGAYASTQERILIENWIVRFRPALVVMYTGYNDTYFGYAGKDILMSQDYMGFEKLISRAAPNNLPYVPLNEGVGLPSPPDQRDYLSKFWFRLNLAVYMIRQGPTQSGLKNAILARQKPRATVVRALLANLHAVQDLSKRHRFRLAVVLQPSLNYTQKHLTGFEKSRLDAMNQNFFGFGDYNKALYQDFRRRLSRDSKKEGYLFLNADEAILAERRSVFTDDVHLGDRGNGLVGRWLATRLAALLNE